MIIPTSHKQQEHPIRTTMMYYQRRIIIFFSMYHSSQQEEQTFHQQMDCHMWLYVWERRKGGRIQKRRWGIEMNEAHETYLKNYIAIDKIDQMLLGQNLSYKSWRWWHAPTRHAKSICNDFGILFVPSVCGRWGWSWVECESCLWTKFWAETVSLDGTVQTIKLTIPRRSKDA